MKPFDIIAAIHADCTNMSAYCDNITPNGNVTRESIHNSVQQIAVHGQIVKDGFTWLVTRIDGDDAIVREGGLTSQGALRLRELMSPHFTRIPANPLQLFGGARAAQRNLLKVYFDDFNNDTPDYVRTPLTVASGAVVGVLKTPEMSSAASRTTLIAAAQTLKSTLQLLLEDV